MFKIVPRKPLPWYDVREQTVRLLLWLARKIKKDSIQNYSYFIEEMTKAHIQSLKDPKDRVNRVF